MTWCYLFDIDGTLADITHRLHHIPKDWDAFFAACVDDKPIPHLCDLARKLDTAGCPVVYVSGRSDQVERQTRDWLTKHVGLSPYLMRPLYMRKAGDHRPDYIVKVELLAQIRADGFEPIMAFEDRQQVVNAWRAQGIPCAQVAEGNF